MKIQDFKYLLAYLVPAVGLLSFYGMGWWTFSLLIFLYIIIPIADPIFPSSTENLDSEHRQSRLSNHFFDLLLYSNVFIVYGFLWLYANVITTEALAVHESIGLFTVLVLVLATCGINVAHELGHRSEWYHQWMSRALLLPSHYLHFNIEHNFGHHKNVATDLDPASAKYGENLYGFWWRSTANSYISAWQLETKRLSREGKSFWSLDNKMIKFQIIQAAYIMLLFWLLTPAVALLVMLAGVFSFLMLETINYIEHYGLRRKKLKSGRYERVQPKHSWNSNHEVGRILLYELTRHSDHHFKANKKYQVLDHHEEAKQLPYGYPTSMLMAFVPPLWFRVMNPKVQMT